MITLGQGESLQNASLNDLNLPESLYYHMVGGPRPDSLNKFKFRSPSYQVQEGDTINIDVTSPGATLALGLMFFRFEFLLFYIKDANRMVGKTEFIYICGFKNGSSSSTFFIQTGEV